MKKKFLSAFLAVCMLSTMLVSTSWAAETVDKAVIKIPGTDVTFTLENANSEYGIVSDLSEPVSYCGGSIYFASGSTPTYLFTFPGREGRVTCDAPAYLYAGGIYYMEADSDKACAGGGDLEQTGSWEASYDFGGDVGTSYTAAYISKNGSLSTSLDSELLATVIFAFGYPVNTSYGQQIDNLGEDLLPTKAKRHALSELASSETSQPTAPVFSDVPNDAYYAEPVKWAVEHGVTVGTSATTFSPNATCTNAQILTFIWRAVGSPEPTTANPFTDLSNSAYYAKAAVWAYSMGMVSGTTFDANKACTRAMTVEYLWKQAGSPAVAASGKFTDVPSGAAYAPAVVWAVNNGITVGTSGTTFSPDSICTRGQIMTFLYRAVA